jgi:hypothetical protein
MDFFSSMDISSSALTAERTRMNTISSNLANANSTRTPEGWTVQAQGHGLCINTRSSRFIQVSPPGGFAERIHGSRGGSDTGGSESSTHAV